MRGQAHRITVSDYSFVPGSEMTTYGDGPEPQWAPDPTGRHDYRYWDGTQWTGSVADGEMPVEPPGAWAQTPTPEPTYATEPAVSEHYDPRYSADAADDEYHDDEYDDYADHGGWRHSFWAGVATGGLVVAVIAVAVGLVLSRGGDDGDSGGAAARTTTSAAVTTSTTLPPTTTTTANPGRPPAQVKVYVINSSGAANAATNKMNQLTALGYQNAGLANGATRKGTAVQCKAGFEAEAATLAKNVGAGTVVEAYPNPPPTGSTGADCLVVLGTA